MSVRVRVGVRSSLRANGQHKARRVGIIAHSPLVEAISGGALLLVDTPFARTCSAGSSRVCSHLLAEGDARGGSAIVVRTHRATPL